MLVRRQQQNKQQLNIFRLIPADIADSTQDMSNKYILFIFKNFIDMHCITQKTVLSIWPRKWCVFATVILGFTYLNSLRMTM